MIRSVVICGLVGAATALFTPGVSRAGTVYDVAQGWDLFQTDPAGTTFPGLGNLMGVPLGSFDFDNTFGRGIGVKPTGTTDTIISRLDVVAPVSHVAGASGTTRLLMNALQLETVVPVNFGGLGLDNYFVTLQSARPTGGPPSAGSMTITFDGTGLAGTFTSSIDVFFDILKGSINGPIVFSSDLVLSSSGTAWNDLAPPGAEKIPNVNLFLSGVPGDPTQDFWPVTPFQETHPNGAQHSVTTSGDTPEPASVVLLFIGAIGIGLSACRRRKLSA
jgi:hypothetical protein